MIRLINRQSAKIFETQKNNFKDILDEKPSPVSLADIVFFTKLKPKKIIENTSRFSEVPVATPPVNLTEDQQETNLQAHKVLTDKLNTRIYSQPLDAYEEAAKYLKEPPIVVHVMCPTEQIAKRLK